MNPLSKLNSGDAPKENPSHELLYDWLYVYYAVVLIIIYSILSFRQPPDERLLFCVLILIWLSIDVSLKIKAFDDEISSMRLAEEILSIKQLVRKATHLQPTPEESYSEMRIENGISLYKGDEAHREKKVKIDVIYLVLAYGMTLFALFYTIWPVAFGPLFHAFVSRIFP